MTSRRDWQLQQLGITQWSLRRPGALQGEIAISIPAHVRLVMVAAQLPALTEPLMSDILRALTVSQDQVLQLTPDRVAMLPQGSRCNSWRLGTDAPLVDAIDEALYRHGIPPESVKHLLFTFSGNSPQALLTQALQAYPGSFEQLGIGLHVDGHAAFVGAVYDRVIADANHP